MYHGKTSLMDNMICYCLHKVYIYYFLLELLFKLEDHFGIVLHFASDGCQHYLELSFMCNLMILLLLLSFSFQLRDYWKYAMNQTFNCQASMGLSILQLAIYFKLKSMNNVWTHSIQTQWYSTFIYFFIFWLVTSSVVW